MRIMEFCSRIKAIAAVVIGLWVLWICHLPTGRPRVPLPVEANQLIRPQNTNYSKLHLTYDRIVFNSSDVFISVRTTSRFHESRLLLLLYTWLQTVDTKQVQIITDSLDDIWINAAKEAGFRIVIPPGCEIGHKRTPLCCKTGYEFEQYYKATETGKGYRWFCHFDDDVYVNIPVLMRTLHAHEDKSYLGRWPSRVWKGKKLILNTEEFHEHKRSLFRYANGPAYCISSTLMPQMERYVRGSTLFASICEKLQGPDDMAIGAIIEAILGYNLTEVPAMMNQKTVRAVGHKFIKNQVTISYKGRRRVTIPGAAFTLEQDPTSFLSYHCLLYPSTSWCKHRPKKQINPTLTTMNKSDLQQRLELISRTLDSMQTNNHS